MIRTFLTTLMLLIGSGPALLAAPEPARLVHDETEVSFSFRLVGLQRRGEMEVHSSDILLDLDDISQSRVTVILDTASVSTGIGLLDQELREDDMLDTANYPRIQFQSTSISGTLSNAVMRGNLTVKGVTRPVVLTGGVYRASEASDLSRLVIRASGQLDRRDFGMDGYTDIVPPEIGFEVHAVVIR